MQLLELHWTQEARLVALTVQPGTHWEQVWLLTQTEQVDEQTVETTQAPEELAE